MHIEVFGPGCARCETLLKHTKHAVEQLEGSHEIVKISDYAAMAARGAAVHRLALGGSRSLPAR